MKLERNSWIPFLQADEKTILKRFDLGHIMLGAQEDSDLVGMISFSYSNFSPDDYPSFPKTFREFSSQPILKNYNTAFCYNLAILPDKRGYRYASLLIRAGWDKAKKDGCMYGVADGRCSSYNGSSEFEQEQIKQNTEFKKIIDRYLKEGIFPQQKEFLKDPTLAFYHRVTGCKFLWLIPNFLPEDKPAGGLRVISYKNILEK